MINEIHEVEIRLFSGGVLVRLRHMAADSQISASSAGPEPKHEQQDGEVNEQSIRNL